MQYHLHPREPVGGAHRILAVRAPSDAGEKPEAWHVEVQASFRPNNYIAKLTKRLQKELGRGPSAAIKREPEMVAERVTGWIERKYDIG